MGPIMLDVHGTSLTQEDKEILQHPLVGGLILFSRNYESPAQVAELTKEIRRCKNDDILIAVDHEGGRVQRFRDGFSAIPAMSSIYQQSENLAQAELLAKACGTLMALEVQAVGIDISFAPVLDVDDISEVIGDRAFHKETELVTPLANAFINGMKLAGMQATGKHFPGHGSVKADSHLALPIDERSQEQIMAIDFPPFEAMIKQKQVEALMPAHIIFTAFDKNAVGFSPYWLQTILREKLGFDGVIFSDDLSMEGAVYVGGFIERAEAAQQAGCDMLLVCNNRSGAIDVLDHANIKSNQTSSMRLQRMLLKAQTPFVQLSQSTLWQEAKKSVSIAFEK